MHLQPETGFRESFRIIGDTVITVQDYTQAVILKMLYPMPFIPSIFIPEQG